MGYLPITFKWAFKGVFSLYLFSRKQCLVIIKVYGGEIKVHLKLLKFLTFFDKKEKGKKENDLEVLSTQTMSVLNYLVNSNVRIIVHGSCARFLNFYASLSFCGNVV